MSNDLNRMRDTDRQFDSRDHRKPSGPCYPCRVTTSGIDKGLGFFSSRQQPTGSGDTNAAGWLNPGKPEQCPGAWVRKARARSKCGIPSTDSLAELRAGSIGASASESEATDRRNDAFRSKDARHPKGCSVLASLPPSGITLLGLVQHKYSTYYELVQGRVPDFRSLDTPEAKEVQILKALLLLQAATRQAQLPSCSLQAGLRCFDKGHPACLRRLPPFLPRHKGREALFAGSNNLETRQTAQAGRRSQLTP